MGYDAHITRAKSWADNASQQISAEEWLAYVAKDPELSLSSESGPYFARWNGQSVNENAWLDWSQGNVYSKNPDAALLEKMAAVARALQAQVQGDDGEVYWGGHEQPAYSKPSVFDRVRKALRALRPGPRIAKIDPPFGVGDRVLDIFHRHATVLEIDPKAEHGLGRVKIRYDSGNEASFMLAASGLMPSGESEDGQSKAPN